MSRETNEKSTRQSRVGLSTGRLGIVDKESGEMINDGMMIYIPKKVKIKEGWFMAMQEGFEHLAKARIRGESMSVLMYLFSKLDFENFIRISQKQICDELSLNKTNVSRSIRDLRERGIIKNGPDRSLKLCNDFGWRGSVQSLRLEQAEEMKSFIKRTTDRQQDALSA